MMGTRVNDLALNGRRAVSAIVAGKCEMRPKVLAFVCQFGSGEAGHRWAFKRRRPSMVAAVWWEVEVSEGDSVYNSRHMETATAATSAAGGQVADGSAACRTAAAGVGRKSGCAPRLCRRGRQPRSGAWRDARRSLGVFARARGCGAGAILSGPLVVVAPHPGEIDAIARDLALFSDAPVREVSGLGIGAGRARCCMMRFMGSGCGC